MKSKLMVTMTAGAFLAWAGTIWGQSSFLDPSFDPGSGANDLVESVLAQPDGQVLICGIFTQFNGMARNYIARLNSNGSVDDSFVATPSYWVRYMALQPDGKIVIGGFFTSVAGVPRNRVARLNSDGSLDTSFDPGAGCQGKVVPADDKDPFVFSLAMQSDGKIVVAGNFATYNNQPSSGIVRLNADGSLDTSFPVGAGFDSWGRFLLLLPNDQIMATGWFTRYNNQPFNRMVRLNSDGSADHGFNPYFGDDTAIYATVLLPDGKMIASGHSINSQGLFRQELERLNPDGTVDTNYNAKASDKVESIYLQPDGKIIIGGYFSQVNGATRNGLARLNPDGTLDDSFKAETDNFVWTIRPEPDGKVLVCGGFSTIDGIMRRGVARLFASTNGVVLPRLMQPQLDHGEFRVSIPTTAGQQYILQYRSFSSTNWSSMPPVVGDGTVHQFVDPSALSSQDRMYRAIMN